MVSRDPDQLDGRWSLISVFDGVALVLLGSVAVLAVAGGVAGAWPDLTSVDGYPSPITPLNQRLDLALSWANPVVGLMLLAGVALLVLPRVAWADLRPNADRRLSWLLVAFTVLSSAATVAGIAWAINWLRYTGGAGGGVTTRLAPQVAGALIGSVISATASATALLANRSGIGLADASEDTAD